MDTSNQPVLSELLGSGGEIEGLFQEKRRVGMEKLAFLNGSPAGPGPRWGLDDPDRETLSRHVTEYNRKMSAQYNLQEEEDRVYSGLLRFHYHSGQEVVSDDFQVCSTTTSAELVPDLTARFFPEGPVTSGSIQMDSLTLDTRGLHSYIALMQGEMERPLDMDERPLQIALDCSSKGLALPKFVFKTSAPTVTSNGSLPPHHTSKFTSYVGPLASSISSMPALHHNDASGTELQSVLSQSTGKLSKIGGDGDRTSVNSFGSGHSSSSSKSGKGALKSTMSLPSGPNAALEPWTRGGKKGLAHTLSNQESKHNTSPAQGLHSHLTSSPTTPRRYSRPKSVMTNFISRSLRLRKKSKNNGKASTSFDNGSESQVDTPTASITSTTSVELASLVSPLPLERRFTMSTVMQIYYTDARKAQLYKSVLVSEKATTREVIAQALERYNLKLSDPDDFTLFEVIGKWQDVTQTLQTHKAGMLGVPTGAATLGCSPLARHQAVTSVEEFVVCYSRELSPSESPYSAQLYLTTQEGFTRRFELRSKNLKRRPQSQVLLDERIMQEERGRTHSSSQLEIPLPASPLGIFGDTSHRRRNRNGRRKWVAQDSPPQPVLRSMRPLERPASPTEIPVMLLSDTSSVDGEGGIRIDEGEVEHDRDELQEIPINLNPNHPPDFSGVTCSSPDSGVAFHKDQANSTKSSVSSEQSDAAATKAADSLVTCSLYQPSLTAAFLLSLRLHDPEKEFLMHKLQASVTYLTPASTSGLSPVHSGANPSVDSEDRSTLSAKVQLHLPGPVTKSLTSCQPVCCICRKEIKSKSSNAMADAKSLQSSLTVSRYEYSLQVLSDEIIVSLNGHRANSQLPLSHGDLVAIGKAHLFMFQDYGSVLGVDIPEYNWWPHPVDSDVRERHTPRAAIQEPVAVVNGDMRNGGRGEGGRRGSDDSGTTSTRMVIREVLPRRPDSNPRIIIDGNQMDRETDLTTPDLNSPTNGILMFRVGTSESIEDLSSSASAPLLSHRSSSGDRRNQVTPRFPTSRDDSFEVSDPFEADVHYRHKPAVSGSTLEGGERRPQNGTIPSSPSNHPQRDRKLMFSFHLSEEDPLLSFLVTRRDPLATRCKLAPAYVLAMCVEFSLRCNGPVAAARFVHKAAECIQEVVWECTMKVKEWQPTGSLVHQSPAALKERFSLLHPVFFWLSNTLEFYHFLTESCDPLDFTSLVTGGGEEVRRESEAEEDPLSTLHTVLVYTFQQAFYSVSNILCHTLPVMLESCTEDKVYSDGSKPEDYIVIDQAVEFLQALLDMLTELNLHLGVVSQFYAHIFFFINTVMFNSLVEQGGELGLFQHASGTALRANLNLLEGWACQVGFKDAVLHYLAKFSSAVDLLATPAEGLLQMDWHRVCAEFPALHPAQLHFLLSHYLLPSSMDLVPTHWTPSKKDASLALNTRAVQESFKDHPGFQLPAAGYTLDLTQSPPQPDEFQVTMETLRKNLKKPKRSVDIVPVVESHPRASIPTVITNGQQTSPPSSRRKGSETESTVSHLHSSQERLLDSSLESTLSISHGFGSNTESQEDLLEDDRRPRKRNNRDRVGLGKHHRGDDALKLERTVNILNSYDGFRKESIMEEELGSHKERVERVHSLVGPRSFATPEKLILHSEDGVGSADDEWMLSRYPRGSHTITIQRGDKGFGIMMVEGKDQGSGDSAIFIQRVLSGSTAEQTTEVVSGDRILAIDGQLLDGADYLIAERYLKEAEDEVSLVIGPRTHSFASC